MERMDTSGSGGRLLGKVAVVTGASRGIGRAVTQLFAGEGARVFAVARTPSDLARMAQETTCPPGAITTVSADVTDPASVEALFGQVDASCGTVDVLVNSAGIAPFGSIFDMDPEAFRACLELNVWAAFLCTQGAVRVMRRRGQGKVINIGSVRSHWSEAGDAGAYNASKYGLRGFTESVARELHGQGMEIGVSMVCPGVVDTTLTNPAKEPKPDWLRPETVAEAVLYAATAPANVNVYDVTLFTTWQKPW